MIIIPQAAMIIHNRTLMGDHLGKILLVSLRKLLPWYDSRIFPSTVSSLTPQYLARKSPLNEQRIAPAVAVSMTWHSSSFLRLETFRIY